MANNLELADCSYQCTLPYQHKEKILFEKFRLLLLDTEDCVYLFHCLTYIDLVVNNNNNNGVMVMAYFK